MIDTITKKRLEVNAYGNALPFIIVPENQLDQLRALLDADGVGYEVDEDSMSVDGSPFVIFVTLARGTDPKVVQQLLDEAP